jgi:hypothetical protein
MTDRLYSSPYQSNYVQRPCFAPLSSIMVLCYNPFYSPVHAPTVFGSAIIFNNPLPVIAETVNVAPVELKSVLNGSSWPITKKPDLVYPVMRQQVSCLVKTSDRITIDVPGCVPSPRVVEASYQQAHCRRASSQTSSPETEFPENHILWSHLVLQEPSEKSQSYTEPQSNNHIEERHSSGAIECISRLRGPWQFQPEHDVPKIQKAFEIYFYTEDWSSFPNFFSEKEMILIKIFLIKKTIHDNNRAKRYQQIVTVGCSRLKAFMENNPAINRKNVIKMNIFVKIWNHLRQKHRGRFWGRYFAEIKYQGSPLSKLTERSSISTYLNINDRLYSLCFSSHLFQEDFLLTLASPVFFESLLYNSKCHFNTLFSSWTAKIIEYVEKTPNVFFGRGRTPEIKFGLSKADVLAAPFLFKKLMTSL